MKFIISHGNEWLLLDLDSEFFGSNQALDLTNKTTLNPGQEQVVKTEMEPEMEAVDPMLTTVTTMTTRTVTVTKQPTIILAAAGNPQLHPQHSVSPPIVTIKTEPADQLSDAMEQTGVLINVYLYFYIHLSRWNWLTETRVNGHIVKIQPHVKMWNFLIINAGTFKARSTPLYIKVYIYVNWKCTLMMRVSCPEVFFGQLEANLNREHLVKLSHINSSHWAYTIHRLFFLDTFVSNSFSSEFSVFICKWGSQIIIQDSLSDKYIKLKINIEVLKINHWSNKHALGSQHWALEAIATFLSCTCINS